MIRRFAGPHTSYVGIVSQQLVFWVWSWCSGFAKTLAGIFGDLCEPAQGRERPRIPSALGLATRCGINRVFGDSCGLAREGESLGISGDAGLATRRGEEYRPRIPSDAGFGDEMWEN